MSTHHLMSLPSMSCYTSLLTSAVSPQKVSLQTLLAGFARDNNVVNEAKKCCNILSFIKKYCSTLLLFFCPMMHYYMSLTILTQRWFLFSLSWYSQKLCAVNVTSLVSKNNRVNSKYWGIFFMQMATMNNSWRSAGVPAVFVQCFRGDAEKTKCSDYKLDKLSAVDSAAFFVCQANKTKHSNRTGILRPIKQPV